MNREELNKIFDEVNSEWDGDNAFQGLQIISKYFDIKETDIIAATEHDVLYSVQIDEILEAGLTQEDAKSLAMLNWMLDDELECLACYT